MAVHDPDTGKIIRTAPDPRPADESPAAPAQYWVRGPGGSNYFARNMGRVGSAVPWEGRPGCRVLVEGDCWQLAGTDGSAEYVVDWGTHGSCTCPVFAAADRCDHLRAMALARVGRFDAHRPEGGR